MPYFFVPEITGFVHLHTFWEDFWQPKRSSNCEEKLWKLRIKVQPISKRGTLITEWKYLKLHLVVEPNLDLLTYSIWPWNLNHATLKRSGFSKIKTQNHCLGYPEKSFQKGTSLPIFIGSKFLHWWFQSPMALLESLQFAACVLSRRPVGCRAFTQRPVEGNLKTLQGNEKPRKATEIYHFFQGNSQRSYTQLLDLALILVGTGEKQIHVDT